MRPDPITIAHYTPLQPLQSYIPPKRSAPQADPEEVRQLVQTLLSAQAPVILAGLGIFYAEAWQELQELADLLQVPVMTTMNGKSCFPENHPLALGAGGATRPRTVSHFLDQADLVLGVGTSFTRSPYITTIPPGKTMLQVSLNEDDLSKDYPIRQGMIGDAKPALRQIIDESRKQLQGKARPGSETMVQEIARVKKAFLQEWLPRLNSDESPISPYRIIRDLMQTVDLEKTVVTHEAGNPRDQLLPFYEAVLPHGYMGWGKTTQLGISLGLMMGAKLAAPDWTAVNIMGDGAFGMVGMDFETAVRNNIPILTIVLNNGLLGGYDHHLPIATKEYKLRYFSGNYAKVAEALGGYSERVRQPEEVKPALERAIDATKNGQAALLDILNREEAIFLYT